MLDSAHVLGAEHISCEVGEAETKRYQAEAGTSCTLPPSCLDEHALFGLVCFDQAEAGTSCALPPFCLDEHSLFGLVCFYQAEAGTSCAPPPSCLEEHALF